MSTDQTYEDAMGGKRPQGVVEKLIEQYPEEMREYRPTTKTGAPTVCDLCNGTITRTSAKVAGQTVHAYGPCEVLAYRRDRDKWMRECRRLRKRVQEQTLGVCVEQARAERAEARCAAMREAIEEVTDPNNLSRYYDPQTIWPRLQSAIDADEAAHDDAESEADHAE